MKFSPDFLHDLMWLGFRVLKVLVLSFIFGLTFSIGLRYLHEAWKKQSRVKIWIYLSGCGFVLYVFFIGIK